MLTLSAITSAGQKLLAYNFNEDSGIVDTAKEGYPIAENTGFSNGLIPGIGLIISIALSLLGVAFLILTIYGGILWMTAQGNEDQVEKGKKIITNGAIGLIIVLSAYAISFFVISALSGTTK